MNDETERRTQRRFDDKVVVVCGGASGIGLATTNEFLGEGASVVVVDRDVSGADGDAAVCVAADLRDETQVEHAMGSAIERVGPVDVLVNAAGIDHASNVSELDLETWDAVLDTNLRGSFLTAKHALPSLLETKGSIVNVASQLALAGVGGMAAYTASKGGVVAFTRSLALEVAERGVRVNAICPGAVDTPMLRGQFGRAGSAPQGSLDDLAAMHPVGRIGRPAEIARPILFLCSEDASFITGSTFVVDGGYTAA